ncbi:hypothetical protein AAC387_Pa02g4740 [Persea americana]
MGLAKKNSYNQAQYSISHEDFNLTAQSTSKDTSQMHTNCKQENLSSSSPGCGNFRSAFVPELMKFDGFSDIRNFVWKFKEDSGRPGDCKIRF